MSRFKLLLFKLVTVTVVPVLFLLVVEGGLRLVGFGYNTDVFVEEKGIVRSNWPFTFKYFPWSVARPMKTVEFKADKEPGSLRIFVLGGSAAQGFPAADFGIARQLQVMLEKAYPERKVEVINAAITAVNSHVMLPVAKACLEYDPDFLVVYLGNNEVAGPNAAGSLYSGYFKNLSLLRFSDSIKSLRLYQLIQVLSGRHQVASGTSKGMDFYLENSIFEDDERLQTVYRHFDRNLKDILATAAKKDCPVLLSTVGVNLLDSPPFISRESDNAEASYLKGLEMHEAGNDEEALISLKKARDLDGLRLRADSKVNAVIRQQVDGREDQVIFVDAESRFEQGKSGSLSIPGDNDFLDHVHLAFAGNYTVANAFFEVVLSSLGSPKQTTASMEEVASSLAYSKWDQLTLVRKVTDQILNKPPYTNQWNHAETQLSRRRELRKLASRYTPEVIENTWELYENALKKEPGSSDLRRRMSQQLVERGQPEKARELLLPVVGESPENLDAQYELSLVSVSLKKYDEAEQCLKTILAKNPYAIEARNAYLLLLYNSGRLEEAARYNDKLLKDHPLDPDFQHVYARILQAQGKTSEAMGHLRTAIGIDPVHEKSRLLMIEIFLDNNQLSQAVQVAHNWTEVDPESAVAHNEEAQLLARNDDFQGAEEQYRKALALDPDFVVARSNFVQLLARQGRIAEAIRFLSEELSADPGIEGGHSLLGLALDVAGKRKEAIAVFTAGLERNPNDQKILRELAWIKATAKDAQWRDGAEAVRLARRAVELSPTDPDFQQVWAAALAENRQFDNAVLVARHALQLAEAANNQQLAGLIRQCLPAYERKQPIRVN